MEESIQKIKKKEDLFDLRMLVYSERPIIFLKNDHYQNKNHWNGRRIKKKKKRRNEIRPNERDM